MAGSFHHFLQGGKQLVDHLVMAGADIVHDAGLDMLSEQRLAEGVERRLHGGNLRQDIDAVSALFQTLIGSMEKITEDSIKYCLVPGESFLKYEELSYESRIMLDSFFIGIRSLADEYPEYVKIT